MPADLTAKRPACEIERKFKVPPDYHYRLETLGFKLMKTNELLEDTYYDFSNYSSNPPVMTEEQSEYPMLKKDYWLRKRNGIWELKYPMYENIKTSPDSHKKETPDLHIPHSTSQTDMYYEERDMEDIVSRLKNICITVLKQRNIDLDCSLDQWVESGVLWPFAEIQTNRKEYRLSLTSYEGEVKSNNSDRNFPVNAVIDITNWGYTIGEIEIVIDNPEEAAAAVLEIDQISAKLSLISAEKKGKLTDYLKKYRPCAYNIFNQRSIQMNQ